MTYGQKWTVGYFLISYSAFLEDTVYNSIRGTFLTKATAALTTDNSQTITRRNCLARLI